MVDFVRALGADAVHRFYLLQVSLKGDSILMHLNKYAYLGFALCCTTYHIWNK